MSTQKNLAVLGLAVALSVAACGSGDSTDSAVGSSTTSAADSSTSAVETSETPDTSDSSDTSEVPETTAEQSDTSVSTATTSTSTSAASSSSSSSSASTTDTTGPLTSEVAAEDPTTTTSTASIPEAAEEFVEPTDDELIEAVTRSLIDEQRAEAYPTSDAELRCVSSTVVEDIGRDNLVAAGMAEDGSGSFRPADLTDADQETLVEAFLTCVNVENLFASQVSGGNIDETVARCLAREMSDSGLLEGLIRPSILGGNTPAIEEQDSETQDAFLDAFRRCLDFEDEMARGFMEDGVISESSARCLAERMNEEGLLDRIMRTQLTGVALTSEEDVAAQALMLDLARECLTDAEAERLSLG